MAVRSSPSSPISTSIVGACHTGSLLTVPVYFSSSRPLPRVEPRKEREREGEGETGCELASPSQLRVYSLNYKCDGMAIVSQAASVASTSYGYVGPLPALTLAIGRGDVEGLDTTDDSNEFGWTGSSEGWLVAAPSIVVSVFSFAPHFPSPLLSLAGKNRQTDSSTLSSSSRLLVLACLAARTFACCVAVAYHFTQALL